MPRLQPVEFRTYRIRARLLEYKREADRDFHVVVEQVDRPGPTMVVEVVDPTCPVANSSPQLGTLAAVRRTFVNGCARDWRRRFGASGSGDDYSASNNRSSANQKGPGRGPINSHWQHRDGATLKYTPVCQGPSLAQQFPHSISERGQSDTAYQKYPPSSGRSLTPSSSTRIALTGTPFGRGDDDVCDLPLRDQLLKIRPLS
jgi:hypothetical protein